MKLGYKTIHFNGWSMDHKWFDSIKNMVAKHLQFSNRKCLLK